MTVVCSMASFASTNDVTRGSWIRCGSGTRSPAKGVGTFRQNEIAKTLSDSARIHTARTPELPSRRGGLRRHWRAGTAEFQHDPGVRRGGVALDAGVELIRHCGTTLN